MEYNNFNENYSENDMKKNSLTFALDIGTRSIVGLIGIHENGKFKILDYEQRFHTKRAMSDGQIEDINAVSETVNEVKRALEKRFNQVFTKVCIAAAGRTLKTAKAIYEQEINENEEINENLVHALEYCAVGAAKDKFKAENNEISESISFYPVGYSIISYKLDNYAFSSLIGHTGKNVRIELIAAFLPSNVVQSLYAVTKKNNLEVENLTLEPIAAINVIVPTDIRLLNISIVDIGAGTSDIAISKNGSIVAYDMVTTAGDEITESIMENYLTDFDTSEQIKLSLCKGESEISFNDILGNSYTESVEKIIEAINPVIQSLGEAIAQRIIDINGKSPVAVFLVGGGSQIPGLCKIISTLLNLNENRVALGGKSNYKYIEVFSDKLLNPEFVTPIGIGAVSSLYKNCDFFSITVNNKKYSLLNYGNAKVLDALLLASIKPKNLIGISSKPIIYFLNGKKCSRRGNSSTPGELYLNGKPASIDTKIVQGDEIVAIEGVDGKPVELKTAELKNEIPPFTISLNGIKKNLLPALKKDNEILTDDYIVKPFDEITYAYPKTIKELFDLLDINRKDISIELNGTKCSEGTAVSDNDEIVTYENSEEESIEAAAEATNSIDFSENEVSKKIELPEKNIPSASNIISVCINNSWIKIDLGERKNLFFVDMLNYVDIDPKNPKGNIMLKLNGKDAAYLDSVTDGDKIEIYWQTNNVKHS